MRNQARQIAINNHRERKVSMKFFGGVLRVVTFLFLAGLLAIPAGLLFGFGLCLSFGGRGAEQGGGAVLAVVAGGGFFWLVTLLASSMFSSKQDGNPEPDVTPVPPQPTDAGEHATDIGDSKE
jgi:hypothetical protein